jgi:hypothetical protein
MIRKLMLVLFILTEIYCFGDNSVQKDIDKLNYDGKFTEALLILENSIMDNPDNINTAWLIAQETAFISGTLNDKKIKIEMYEKGIMYTAPFLNKLSKDPKEQANLLYWYTVNYASKIKEQGIFAGRQGLNIIPEVFKLIDKCIEFNPELSEAYFFRGKLYGEIPEFLGGNKIKMEINYTESLKFADEDLKIFLKLEILKSLLKRNWTIEKKIKEASKQKIKTNDLLSSEMNDNVLSGIFLNEIISTLKKKNDLSFRENSILNESKNILMEKKEKKQ